MTDSIGEKLRLARETRGIALRDISEQTRISMRYLEAIESDDYRRLPGGIFNRSFIRAYAKFVGYDEDQAIDDYSRTLRELGQPDEESEPKTFKSLVYTDDASHRSPLKNLLLAIVILAILTACVLGGLHFYRRRLAPKTLPGTVQPFAPGRPVANWLIHIPSVHQTKEGEHEFTV
jgi:cytoskeletal protein RodZ